MSLLSNGRMTLNYKVQYTAYLKAVSQRLPRRAVEVKGNMSEELNSESMFESWTFLS